MRYYELMWILGADADEEGIEQSIEAIDERIENHGGERLRSAAWGRRSLAYPINHNAEGIYNVVQFSMEPDESVLFEREILADQAVIRHLQLRIEEVELLPEAPVLPPTPPVAEDQPETPAPEDTSDSAEPEDSAESDSPEASESEDAENSEEEEKSADPDSESEDADSPEEEEVAEEEAEEAEEEVVEA
ncbi:MAG: 30S ribosomal protein S6 [Chloroflexi bacterium]|nr:30S ribosomal protein S6 [Chloroflexota bacterium]MBT4072610.1 30S ribosomal protein S6 [Chloroflexota bacterium]MBT6682607.1 30S ribosomal protein S6 [Chloroflexota bacterium]